MASGERSVLTVGSTCLSETQHKSKIKLEREKIRLKRISVKNPVMYGEGFRTYFMIVVRNALQR